MSDSSLMSRETHFCSIIRLSVLLLFGACKGADEISDANRPIPLVSVEGVLKEQGKLPCDVQVPTRDDRLHMVLWFRDNGQPIYRYDVRWRSLSDAKRWSDVGDRVYFQAMSEPAHLLIGNLNRQDEGVYRCRVDFKNSPTRNLRINLTIIVPPDKPVIYDSNGVTSLNIGPYNEGGELLLTCEVHGGRPKPRVSWWLENAMIDGDGEERKDGLVVNHLKFSPLLRHHLNARFVCLASNTNQTLPQSTVAVLNMNLRPLNVSITTKDPKLVAEKRYDIECTSIGSRPPASITWLKNGSKIKKAQLSYRAAANLEDNNVTRSILSFVPSVEDNGKMLSCKSENTRIEGSGIEDRWRLNVHYPPKISVQLGPGLIADEIKEGDGVYFECLVKSNPPYIRLSWFHMERELRHNISQRIILSNTRLVLQGITRHSAGGYYCSAYNSEGLSQSNVIQLRVKYVPICKSKEEVLIGAMRNETVVVRCEMEADPPTGQFFWTFNNSGMEVLSVPNSRLISSGGSSILNYTPTIDAQFGTLSCYGSNTLGQGNYDPCRFQIVQAGPPFPPKNCSIFNETEDSATVSCAEGFNGGLAQIFHIEVFDTQANQLRFNSSSGMPFFTVEGLEASVPFTFILYSTNSKGQSEPIVIDGVTFRGFAKYTVIHAYGCLKTGSTAGEVFQLYLILVLAILVLIIVLSALITVIWKRSRRKKLPVVKHVIRMESAETLNSSPTTPAKVNGINTVDNPDVVPSRNGGLRGFIRIHKTPPAKRRKKNLEVKYNGETVCLTAETPVLECRDEANGTNFVQTSSQRIPPLESRI